MIEQEEIVLQSSSSSIFLNGSMSTIGRQGRKARRAFRGRSDSTGQASTELVLRFSM